MMSQLDSDLRQGITALGLELGEQQVAQLLAYLGLLQKWNKVYNLTSVRDPAGMLTHHLLDSLSVVGPLLRQTDGSDIRMLDVGSGAGLPGVVVAICCPQVRVDCVDAVAKKAAFIRQVAAELQLPNLRGLHARVESLTESYDLIASRAFASLPNFVTWSIAALAPDGVWMAMKGKHPRQDIESLPPAVAVFHVEQVTVPGLAAERCLIWLRRASGVT